MFVVVTFLVRAAVFTTALAAILILLILFVILIVFHILLLLFKKIKSKASYSKDELFLYAFKGKV